MATKFKVIGEQVFQVEAPNFAISPSESGYTLNYSADGVNFTAWDEITDANKTQVVAGAACGMFYKLVDNVSEVTICF